MALLVAVSVTEPPTKQSARGEDGTSVHAWKSSGLGHVFIPNCFVQEDCLGPDEIYPGVLYVASYSVSVKGCVEMTCSICGDFDRHFPLELCSLQKQIKVSIHLIGFCA